MRTNALAILAAGAVLGLGVGTASAAAINVLNPGFETDAAPDGAYWHTASNWDVADADWGDGYGDPGVGEYVSQAGDINNVAYLNPDGTMFQNLVYADLSPVLVAAWQDYTISADFGRRLDVTVGDSPVEVRIVETATSTVLDSAIYQVASQPLGSFTNQNFLLSTGASPAGVGSQVRLEFHLNDDFIPPSPDQAHIDNVVASVVVVPEPAALSLLALGALALVRRR